YNVGGEISLVDQPPEKKRKTEVSPISKVHCIGYNALVLLLSIETTPISISTSRGIQQLISKIQMDLSAGRIPQSYVLLVLNGLLGTLNNRFSVLRDPILECIAVLLSKHFSLVWDNLIGYLENCQLKLHSTSNLHDGVNGA
ncbi:hypothetical protein PIB30_114185, partial [Stylosanthes scabra]|nr:hypothetical protein [Stylosanthes scabra]